MTRCPHCRADIEVSAEQDADEALRIHLEEKDTFENYLLECLYNFWRCRGEDDRKYKDEQYYYDPYHKHIEYDKKTDTYNFCIQIHDSPEGDTWVHGKFKLGSKLEGPAIEMLEHHSSSSAFG